MNNINKSQDIHFNIPLEFILEGVIAKPQVIEESHIAFINLLYAEYKIGPMPKNEMCDLENHFYNINEIIYIGEKFPDLDLFLLANNVDDKHKIRYRLVSYSQKSGFLEIDKINRIKTYESISEIFDKANLNNNNQILMQYIIYKYFTDKKYVVKDGLKFGVDFVLYSSNLSVVHGKYCILICNFEEGDTEVQPNTNSNFKFEEITYSGKKYKIKFPIIDFKKIISLSRLCESISKTLILSQYNPEKQVVESIEISRFSNRNKN
ncbi:tRNA-splicing endonuclease subunit Sen2 [Cryptosporidium felis]|nr:tRNA-splicing endonuclease subunit Sen2 [Cryptosporidium felis]